MFKTNVIIFSFVNFVLLITGLFYLLRKPISKYIFSRSESAKQRRDEAISRFEKSDEDYNKYFNRLKDINLEMNSLMEKAEADGEIEGQKSILEVEKVADRIISQSLNKADYEVKKKNVEFYKGIVEKSMNEAESLIKKEMTTEVQIKLGRSFLTKLEEAETVKKG